MDSKKQQLGVLTLAGFALLSADGPLGTDMYLPALPLIGRDLGASPAVGRCWRVSGGSLRTGGWVRTCPGLFCYWSVGMWGRAPPWCSSPLPPTWWAWPWDSC